MTIDEILTLYHTIMNFNDPENIVEKAESAGNQHCLLFLQCFFYSIKVEIIILETLTLLSAKALNFVLSKKIFIW